ncbi:MAG TPA: hypothetical protein PK199_11070 [Bacteroidales bacterium]|nr:hypothetical protein [Bacteroidales bacterium]
MNVLFFSFFLICIGFFSCNTKAGNSAIASFDDSIQEAISQPAQVEKKIAKNLPAPKNCNLLLPTCYRLFEYDYSKCISNKWLELYEVNGMYFLAPPVYKIADSYDECAEVASKCIRGSNDRNTIVFLNNPQFVSGEIKTSYPIFKDITPNNSAVFNNGNESYSVGVIGDLKENAEFEDNWESYTNLLLRITRIDSEGFHDQHLFTYDNLSNDSYFKVLFAGDLNNDNRPDFIIEVSTFYEEYTIYVYLSNDSQTAPFFELYAQLLYQFDC